jgi:O-antigen ligase
MSKNRKGYNMMDDQTLSDKLAAIAVALLLILTAWGNAAIMLIVAVLGLIVSATLFRKRITKGGALSAALGCIVAVAVALIMLLQ